jgi:hypothetical protein
MTSPGGGDERGANIMTFMTARQAWSHPVGPNQVRPFHLGRHAADPRMVAGRPAPPGY